MCAVVLKVTNAEHKEGQVESEEERKERNGGAERALDKLDMGKGHVQRFFLLTIRSKKVKMNHPIKKRPKEFRKGAALPSPSSVETIWKPPGVRMMAKEIQNPP